MSKKTSNAVKNEAIKFKVSDNIYELMKLWLKTLQSVYKDYHTEMLKGDLESEARRIAIGNMLLMIDFIDNPELTIAVNLKSEDDKLSLKGMLAAGRLLRDHLGNAHLEQPTEELADIEQAVEEQLDKVI